MNKTIKKYDNIADTYAYVGFPKGFAGITEPFYGSYDEFKNKYPNITVDQAYPTLLYTHSSSGLYRGEVYRKYIVEELGFIFFAPNSHKTKNRPFYKSPTKKSKYIVTIQHKKKKQRQLL